MDSVVPEPPVSNLERRPRRQQWNQSHRGGGGECIIFVDVGVYGNSRDVIALERVPIDLVEVEIDQGQRRRPQLPHSHRQSRYPRPPVEIRESRVMRRAGIKFSDPVHWSDETFTALNPYTAVLA